MVIVIIVVIIQEIVLMMEWKHETMKHLKRKWRKHYNHRCSYCCCGNHNSCCCCCRCNDDNNNNNNNKGCCRCRVREQMQVWTRCVSWLALASLLLLRRRILGRDSGLLGTATVGGTSSSCRRFRRHESGEKRTN